VGDTLRFGTSLVPDADSLELKRVSPDARTGSVLEVVTPHDAVPLTAVFA